SAISGSEAYRFVTIGVSGLQGGHSGMDIHRERGNSNRLLGRTLAACAEKFDLHLVSVKGGSAMNVLPAESAAVIFTNAPEAALKAELAHWEATFKNELKASDGAGLVLTLKDAPASDTVLSAATLQKLLTALTLIPHGVQAMDLNMKDQTLVESSNNLAVLSTDDEGIHINCASRSSVGSKKVFIYEQIKAVADAIGATLTYSGDYPAWEYNPTSKLRDTFRAAYKTLFGKDAKVEGIHAGLECGLFSEKFKELGHDVDFVAFGPNISGAHSVNEKVSRSSVENMWKLLKEVLKNLGGK
ncbi:M20/M25/M40 family metallo-hydrolase, partial [Desulfovibrio sp. OttesenSCG-928-I05]|nr:M20/M25/M40 family metallo-hydrolase [Desulfovibrio sp. OttesenSCG-928-I05]